MDDLYRVDKMVRYEFGIVLIPRMLEGTALTMVLELITTQERLSNKRNACMLSRGTSCGSEVHARTESTWYRMVEKILSLFGTFRANQKQRMARQVCECVLVHLVLFHVSSY